MSTKEAVIDMIRRLPDGATIQDIVSALQDWSTDEVNEDEWRRFVAHSLADELSDPREDIYSLEDGVPSK